MLLLLVGGVAGPDRPGALIAGQVGQRLLGQLVLAAHAVHDLEGLAIAAGIGDEIEEVVGLAVESQRVETPQGKGGVAHPGIAIVPVALALWRLGQAGGRRGQQGPGRRVREAFEGQGTALEVAAPAVIGEVAQGDPLPPVLGRAVHAFLGILVGHRGRKRRPRQGHEVAVALHHAGAGVEAPALDPGTEVGGDAKLDAGAIAGGDDLAVPVAFVDPIGLDAGVVKHGVAGHGEVDRTTHAPDRAQQAVLGVVVGRRAPVGLRTLRQVVPGTHAQGVAHDQPARAGLPGRLDHEAARQVAAGRRHHLVVGTDPERPGAAVEQRTEDGRRVGPRHAHPLDRPARGDQAGRFAVREERIIGDERETGCRPIPPGWRRPRTPLWWRRVAVVRWPSR